MRPGMDLGTKSAVRGGRGSPWKLHISWKGDGVPSHPAFLGKFLERKKTAGIFPKTNIHSDKAHQG